MCGICRTANSLAIRFLKTFQMICVSRTTMGRLSSRDIAFSPLGTTRVDNKSLYKILGASHGAEMVPSGCHMPGSQISLLRTTSGQSEPLIDFQTRPQSVGKTSIKRLWLQPDGKARRARLAVIHEIGRGMDYGTQLGGLS